MSFLGSCRRLTNLSDINAGDRFPRRKTRDAIIQLAEDMRRPKALPTSSTCSSDLEENDSLAGVLRRTHWPVALTKQPLSAWVVLSVFGAIIIAAIVIGHAGND